MTQTLTLLCPTSFAFDRYADVLEREAVEVRAYGSFSELVSSGRGLCVVLVDRSVLRTNGALPRFQGATVAIGIGVDEEDGDAFFLHLGPEPSRSIFASALRRAYQFLWQRQRTERLERLLQERTRELQQVSEVGSALSTVRDHAVLLTMILSKARELSRADAGSLYLLDEVGGRKVLRWKLAQNDSIDAGDFEEKILPVTRKSLAGYVAMTGETLVIDDAYNLPRGAEYEINRSFDEANGYLTKSLMAFPMTSHDGDIIGVLQLINRRVAGAPQRLTAATVPDNVVAFDDGTVEIMRALASQAAVAVENNQLYESIERLFEGFVTAAVTAIEQRDPTTSGHSFRVADLTVELARVIDRIPDGLYGPVSFTAEQVREIRYASLLHDFGKVGVREQVLVKEKKLYPAQLATIRSRFEYLMKTAENDGSRRKIEYLLERGRDGWEEFAATVDAEIAATILTLQKDFAFIAQSNEPTVLPEGEFQYLQQLATRAYLDINGERRLLVEPEEARILSIRKGNLDAAERLEIESHVTHTFNFLLKIPWTRDLAAVADIAFAHHEKLNGRGYPRRLTAPDIPLQSRMMTVSDIYDALTASDRPYKRAVPTERALDILKMEVRDGLLDAPLVETFIEAKVFERAGVLRT